MYNVEIKYTDSKACKVTVTADNSIRVKIGNYIKDENREFIKSQLVELAAKLISLGSNETTMRGKTNLDVPNSMCFYNDSRTKSVTIEL